MLETGRIGITRTPCLKATTQQGSWIRAWREIQRHGHDNATLFKSLRASRRHLVVLLEWIAVVTVSSSLRQRSDPSNVTCMNGHAGISYRTSHDGELRSSLTPEGFSSATWSTKLALPSRGPHTRSARSSPRECDVMGFPGWPARPFVPGTCVVTSVPERNGAAFC